MGRTSQTQKKKRAKVKKLMAGTEDSTSLKTGQKSPKELIATAIEFFQNGDEENAKKIAKRVIKVCSKLTLFERA